ncbi:hypothetical protein EAb13_CDS0020 [Acinetobacter phage EAb13]|nr:hypothetical protein EAb13_CDS0020 [Acinetobacter phage EAb13]
MSEDQKHHTNPVLIDLAMMLILKHPSVKSFERESAGSNYRIKNWAGEILVESTDIYDALDWFWANYANNVVYIQMCGKYSLAVRKSSINGTRYYAAIITACDQRQFTSIQTLTYNMLEGYWYTPRHEASKELLKAIESDKWQRFANIFRIYNADSQVKAELKV